VLEHDLKGGIVITPISQTIREIWGDIPLDVTSKLPPDGASQIDHYAYGLPKREQWGQSSQMRSIGLA
jgi:hypothetical protein